MRGDDKFPHAKIIDLTDDASTRRLCPSPLALCCSELIMKRSALQLVFWRSASTRVWFVAQPCPVLGFAEVPVSAGIPRNQHFTASPGSVPSAVHAGASGDGEKEEQPADAPASM